MTRLDALGIAGAAGPVRSESYSRGVEDTRMIIATLIVGIALSFGLAAAAGLYLWLPSGTDPALSTQREFPRTGSGMGGAPNHHADAPLQPHPMGRQNSVFGGRGSIGGSGGVSGLRVSLSLDWLLLSVIGPTSFILLLMAVGGLDPVREVSSWLFCGVAFAVCWPRAPLRRLRDFQRQLPEALDMMGRSLRAGHSLLAGMKMVSDEFPAPVGPEFGRVVEEATFGVPLGDALSHLTDRFDLAALRFCDLRNDSNANRVAIWRKSSRRSVRWRESVSSWPPGCGRCPQRAALSDGALRLAAALAGILYVINAEYIMILFQDPLGQTMVTVAGMLMICGAAITKRMVTVRI